MTNYAIEIGENSRDFVCHCCGKPSFTGHGFIHKNGDTYAVYYAAWSGVHYDKKVSFAITVGEWNDDSTKESRTCFGLEAYDAGDEIQFRVIEPDESPWPSTELLGDILTRNEGLQHPLLKEIFILAEDIIRYHSAIREYLMAQAV